MKKNLVLLAVVAILLGFYVSMYLDSDSEEKDLGDPIKIKESVKTQKEQEGFFERLEDAAEEVFEEVEGDVDALEDEAETLVEEVVDEAKLVGKKISKAVKIVEKDAGKIVKKVEEEVKEVAEEVIDDAKAVGKAIVKGIVEVEKDIEKVFEKKDQKKKVDLPSKKILPAPIKKQRPDLDECELEPEEIVIQKVENKIKADAPSSRFKRDGKKEKPKPNEVTIKDIECE